MPIPCPPNVSTDWFCDNESATTKCSPRFNQCFLTNVSMSLTVSDVLGPSFFLDVYLIIRLHVKRTHTRISTQGEFFLSLSILAVFNYRLSKVTIKYLYSKAN